MDRQRGWVGLSASPSSSDRAGTNGRASPPCARGSNQTGDNPRRAPNLRSRDEILCGAMPNASPVTVPGAAHSMTATYAAEMERLIGENVSKAETLT